MSLKSDDIAPVSHHSRPMTHHTRLLSSDMARLSSDTGEKASDAGEKKYDIAQKKSDSGKKKLNMRAKSDDIGRMSSDMTSVWEGSAPPGGGISGRFFDLRPLAPVLFNSPRNPIGQSMPWHLDAEPPVYLDTGQFLDSELVPSAPSPGERKRMSELALGLTRKNLDQKLALKSSMVAAMTNNPHVPNATALLTEATATGTAIAAKREQLATAKTTLEARQQELDELERQLDAVLNALKKNAESETRGDATKLATCGAPVKGAPAPVGPLPAPSNLRVTGGDQEGTLDAMCDPVDGSSSYIFRHSTTPTGPWTEGYKGTASRCTIPGLVSGQEYYVQAAALGAAGQSPWSDIARKRAS